VNGLVDDRTLDMIPSAVPLEAPERFTSALDAFTHHTPDGTVQGIGGALSEGVGNLMSYFDAGNMLDAIIDWFQGHLAVLTASIASLSFASLIPLGGWAIPISLLGLRMALAGTRKSAPAETIYFKIPDAHTETAKQALLNDEITIRSINSLDGNTSIGVPVYHKGRAIRALANALG